MRRVLVLILVAGLLAGCGLDGRSEADQPHELRVACLQGGGAWNASTSSCGERTPSTLTPVPMAAAPAPVAEARPMDTPVPLPTQPTKFVDSDLSAGQRYVVEFNTLNNEALSTGQTYADATRQSASSCGQDLDCLAEALGPVWRGLSQAQDARIEHLQNLPVPKYVESGHQMYVAGAQIAADTLRAAADLYEQGLAVEALRRFASGSEATVALECQAVGAIRDGLATVPGLESAVESLDVAIALCASART